MFELRLDWGYKMRKNKTKQELKISIINKCPEIMHLITCYLNLDDVTKCPVKSESEPAIYNIRISACVRISFQLRVR